MKLNIILERSNLFETNSEDFDFSRDLISYREVIYSKKIKELSTEAIDQFKYKVFEEMMHYFPRNGFEYINDKGSKSLNVLIIDYSLTENWEQDVAIKTLVIFIESYFEVKKSNETTNIFEMNSIEHTIEIDSYGYYNLENLEDLQKIFYKTGIKFKTVYEKTSEINAGAPIGRLKAIFQIIGNAADITTVFDFLTKQLSYESHEIQDYNLKEVKKQISEYYKIHENQLELESIDYGDEKQETIYLFASRNYQYHMIYNKGELKKTYREKKIDNY